MIDFSAKREIERRQLQNLMGELHLLLPYFEDESVLNIFILGSGKIKIDHFIQGKFIINDINFNPDQIMRIINFLAAMNEHTINTEEYPVLESFIPQYGFRVTAAIKPWVVSPQIAIRRPNPRIITLEEYLEHNRIEKRHYDQITNAIREKKNIVIVGSTGSGKTTFINSCIYKQTEYYPDDRYLIIEDTPELRCDVEDVTTLLIRRDQVQYAINFALRWCPKHITFGEVRNATMGSGFLELLNSGHPGNFTSLHANSARDGFDRFSGLIKDEYARNNIAKYIDLWVYLENQKVLEVLSSESIATQKETLKQTVAQMSLYEGLYNVED